MSTRARAVAGVAVGLLAVPIGLGLAGPHLAKAGLTVVTVAGVALVIVGLALLVRGVIACTRTMARPGRLIVAGAVFVGLALLTWSLGQAVAATYVPRTDLASVTPADRGLHYTEITFAASDGARLSGWFVPSRNGAAVVLLHGAGSTRTDVLDHAVVLARHGYGVLLYDARGHGRSEGTAMDFGWYGDEDLAGAVEALAARDDVDPARIGAVGLSMGGEEAIGAAATVSRLRAVVAEGATNRVAGDKDWLSDRYGFRGALTEQVGRLTYGFADLLSAAGPPISLRDAVTRAAPRRVLLITGGAVPDELEAGRFIQTGSPGTVEVWTAAGAGHTAALATHADEWEARVTAFLAGELGPATVSTNRPS